MATREDLTGFVEALKLPEIPSGGLIAVFNAVREGICASILMFASGRGEEQPDLTQWMMQKKLLGEKGLNVPRDKSAMAEGYSSRKDEFESKIKEMDRQGDAVNDSVLNTFKVANGTFQAIKKRIDHLDGELRSIEQRVNKEGALLPLTAASEARAIHSLLSAFDDVYTKVDEATTKMRTEAGEISSSHPYSPGPTRGGPRLPTPAASNASYRLNEKGTINGILQNARGEVGTVEKAGDDLPGKPYDINDAWCAAFASWTWKEAGYDVKWSNKDYVPSIWADAQHMGLNDGVQNAKPGDMIVFDWNGDGTQDHIGIVESVDGNTIRTIEGNAGARGEVKRNDYQMGSSVLVGVVKPPANSSV
ncbi:CHAP domain-containing protein [Nocardia mexicana]|uniref:CHAP domain-containing protein n=1 Tax=Nocardia mexicana TaxID=279262 RepID=A0A370H3L1_9NOCA|nr:CHAP domain-containing protein [Nocardia mexicana]RDI50786.1 CHAP domain-containing protein [Nocardia mexicana]